MVELLTDPHVWAAFATLTALEIVLGIDNLILISILADKLPQEKQKLARKLGLLVALISRLLLIALAFWIAHLQDPIFTLFEYEVSWRDILLLLGGLFLLSKGTLEIHEKIEGEGHEEKAAKKATSTMATVIMQIAVMDVIFSFDSVMTAIGMTDHLPVMIAAILISIAIMVMTVDHIASFINRHPTVKVLALSYMLLIGLMLIAEGFHMHIPKGYLYFAMAFSFMVEMINLTIRNNKQLATEK
jgi:predicted tellurium resistance membrane protein TerC